MEERGKLRGRKAISATLAVAMVAVMLLSGTLTYFYHSTAVNILKDTKTTKNVVLHDDFDEKTGNKDIYVENLGTSTVFVRVRLTQDYWDSAQDPIEDEDDTTPPYNYMGGYEELSKGTGDSATKVGAKVYKLSGSQTDAEKNFHKNYFSWTMGEGKQKTYLSAAANEATMTDYYGTSKDAANDGKYIDNNKVAFDPQNAGAVYQMESTPDSLIKTTGKSDGILNTLDWMDIYTTEIDADIEQRIDPMKKRYDWTGWIEDSTSGWFYWSQPLKAGETTGLLLDRIKKEGLIVNGDLTYEYHVHVECEAVNTTDMGLWTLEKDTEMDGDSWQAAGNTDEMPDWILTRYLFPRFIEQTENDLDSLIDEMKIWKTDLVSAEAYSPGALNLINQALYAAYEGESKAEDLRKTLETAKTMQNEFIAGGAVDETLFPADVDVDLALKTFLIETYGTDGDLTKEAAKGITSIEYSGNGIEKVDQIADISFITGERFPNLKTLKITDDENLVSQQTVDSTEDNPKYKPIGTALPQSLEGLYFSGCRNILCLDVSALHNLKKLVLYSCTGLFCYGTTEKGAVNFGDTDSESSVYKNLLQLDLRGSHFKAFDSNDFPKLQKLWISSSVMKKINLVGGKNLRAIIMKLHGAFQIDFSDCPFSFFPQAESFAWRTLKAITIRADQHLQTTSLPTGSNTAIVKVVDTADKTKVVRYEKWDKTGCIQTWTESDGNLTDGETAFTAAVAAAEQAEREAGVA